MLKRSTGYGDMENLALYYRDCVIGGSGAFLVPVHKPEQVAQPIRTKIISELTDLPPHRKIQKTQKEASANCLPGKRRLEGWNRN